jgi:tetratricopeptide (TPR) repeat protein
MLRAEVEAPSLDAATVEARFTSLREAARLDRDRFFEMRAWYNLARLARRRSEWLVTVEHAAAAASLARKLGNRFYQGLCLFNSAAALYEAGEFERAGRTFEEAIFHLASSEGLRFQALAEAAYAGLLVACDRFDEALERLERAAGTAASIGQMRDNQIVRHATTWVLYALGRHAEARPMAELLVELDRAGGDAGAELYGLKLLTCVALADGRVEDARSLAGEVERVAETAGAEVDVLEARLLGARCRARSGRAQGLADMRRLTEVALRAGHTHQANIGLVFTAEALQSMDPVAAARALAEARRRIDAAPSAWGRVELHVAERARDASPIRVDADGAIVIDLRSDLPSRAAAHEALDRALILRALERAGGTYAAAGRLIGETRWNVRRLARQYGIALQPEAPEEDS